ncbi:hypothetical protein [Methyloterricola oryzae]|uniref:hypothetical protein n=1 Tax=Methyloterricola oryzae TaxID=1495050 RepID=UPI00138DE93D|nr:hypothetical protein [Methyloterricola oryzae]
MRAIPALGLYSRFELNKAVHDLMRVSWAVKNGLEKVVLASNETAADPGAP